ncbi:DUF429 domain-containing protein [Paraburkholderia sp. BR10882]|uniref:DUF429 domain-containing protein n=1 Tax=unclassified Paraburkholderia TaxID=2615204 RepID=UPI0034CD694B
MGGDKKGCHLVILEGSRAFRPADTKTPQEMLRACLEYGVQAVGIDAPCQWGIERKGRRAERELARQRIFSFATPTRQRADENPGRFYLVDVQRRSHLPSLFFRLSATVISRFPGRAC